MLHPAERVRLDSVAPDGEERVVDLLDDIWAREDKNF
jgi:hypothetical protein